MPVHVSEKLASSTRRQQNTVEQRLQQAGLNVANRCNWLTLGFSLYNVFVMERVSYKQSESNLDAIFAALADPTRRAILSRLAEGEASVKEIAAPFDISQPAISRHLKVLQRSGLIDRNVDQQRRPAKLIAEPMVAAIDWLAEFRRFWGASFDQLDDLLIQLKKNN